METFANMREAKLKLNPEKCVFGVTQGKVLGSLVSTNSIKARPNKIKAILQMHPPQTRKEVQKLTGHIAALNRFIAKLVERSLHFFSVLWGSTKVEWGPKQQRAFDDVTPSFKAKTERIPLCVPGSIFTHKAINSEINSIPSV
jgi:hypothetical protein